LDTHYITGTEVTLKRGYHVTLLAKDSTGYSNLCRLITAAHLIGERNVPELPPELISGHAAD
jgi:error-prone DNA polymerase